MKKFLLIGILPALISCERNPGVSEEVLNAYASGCSVTGSWSEAALAQNRALVDVLESLQENETCAPFREVLNRMTGLNSDLDSILNSSSYSEYRSSEETLQELTLVLNQMETSGADAMLIDELKNRLVNAQVEVATARAGNQRDVLAKSTQRIASSIQMLLNQSQAIGECLEHSPAAAIQLASSVVGMGGSFISPIVGAGTSILATLMNTGIEYAKGKDEAHAVDTLMEAKLPQALTCGLESMTKFYCQAEDAYSLLDLQANSYGSEGISEVWEGLDLLGRRLTVINSWLLRLKTGVAPSNPEEAERQKRVWIKVKKLDERNLEILGELNKRKELHASAKDAESRKNIVIQALSNSVSMIKGWGRGGNGEPDPFREYPAEGWEWACFLIKGPDSPCPAFSQEKDKFDTYIKEKLLTESDPPLIPIFDHWEKMIGKVKTLVDVEFSQTITIDPARLLNLAFQAEPGNFSPVVILERTAKYLQDLIDTDDASNPHFAPFVHSTLVMTQDALAILRTPTHLQARDSDKIVDLFDLFHLKSSTTFYPQRIRDIVNTDIQKRLKNGEYSKDISDLLNSASVDIGERLTAAGVSQLGDVLKDLNSARSLTQASIHTFRDYFSPYFARAIERLAQNARDAGEPVSGPNRPNGQMLAQLCTMVLITGNDWLENKGSESARKICQEQIYYSLYLKQDPALTLSFSKLEEELKGKPLNERLCTFYRYQRAERLVEVMKSRSPKTSPASFQGFTGDTRSFPWQAWAEQLTFGQSWLRD